MIGLCHKCGYMGDVPAKDQGPWAKLWKQLAKRQYARNKIFRRDYYRLRDERDKLMIQLAAQNDRLNSLQETADSMLEILMAPTEASRLGAISKIKKRRNPSKLLLSIRKANKDGS